MLVPKARDAGDTNPIVCPACAASMTVVRDGELSSVFECRCGRTFTVTVLGPGPPQVPASTTGIAGGNWIGRKPR